MNIDTATISKHVAAVTRMLLGNRRMKDGVVIIGGEPLDLDGRLALAEIATESGADLVMLEFDTRTDGTYGISDILIVVERDGICYLQSGCRLWQSKSGMRSLILPRPEARGHYRLSPRELIQIDGKPSDVAEGMERAEARLRKLIRCGGLAPGQAQMTELGMAA